MKPPFRVMIVEDSSSCRLLLEAIVEQDDRLELAGSYESAEGALNRLEEDQPDVISLDIELPGIDGLEATRRILQTRPTPIVIVSSTVSRDQVTTSMKAMEAGALAVLAKPEGPGSDGFERASRQMCSTLYGMSQVKVIRQYAHRRSGAAPRRRTRSVKEGHPPYRIQASSDTGSGLIAVGASTGGPPALEKFLQGFPPGECPPVLIVQHISPGFVSGLASWLADRTGHDVQLAHEGEVLNPGQVRIAPDGIHLQLGKRGRVVLSSEPAGQLHCPSVDVLFTSVAEQMGAHASGVLLTGMGSDGATGLAYLRAEGGWTAVQDEESSVVYGMPKVAREQDAAVFQGTPEQIASQIQRRSRHGLK